MRFAGLCCEGQGRPQRRSDDETARWVSTPSGTGAESAFFPALHRFDVQAMRHWTAVGRYLGCPLTEVHVLMVLGTMGPLAIGQIAKETCMGSAVVTGIVDRLETKGFAKRVNHTLDRRMRVVVLEGPVGADGSGRM